MIPTFTPAHEYADIFALHDQDIADLGKRIEANGLREPIVLLDGKVLDGRRRERACHRAGVKPTYREFGSKKVDGDDPLEFVIDLNLHRRHLGEGERALAAARYATAKAGGNRKPLAQNAPMETPSPAEPTATEAAEKFDTTPSKVKRAKIVVEGGTKPLVKAVQDEKISISDAARVAKLPPKAQNRAVKEVLAGHAATVSEVAFPVCERCKEIKSDGNDCTACAYLRECFASGKKLPKPEPDRVTDANGTVVPQRLVPIFRAVPDFAEAERLLNACSKAFKKIEDGPTREAKSLDPNQHYRKFFVTFKSARARVKAMSPTMVCEKCEGEACEACRQKGWLTSEESQAGVPI